VVLVNAAVALVVCGVAADWKEGMERAAESVDSGAAADRVRALAAAADYT
jgi:anthranilate phosphoribosyltransferase